MPQVGKAKIAKTITLKVEGDTPEDYQRALRMATEELQHGLTGGAGGTNSCGYEIATVTTPQEV